MDLGLTNKVALVLASSGGLGYATAYALAAEGAHVLVSSRSLERARTAAQRITQETSAQVDAFEVDVADANSLAKLFGNVQAATGGIDILVCNAGGPPAGSFSKLSEEQWDAAYQLTMQSVVRSVRLALPQMQARGGGTILALASSSVKSPIPNLLLSNVFRPAVNALCKSLSIELAEDHIRVNCISPGRIETDRTIALDEARAVREGRSFEEVREDSIKQIPLGRLGNLDEFGRVAAFLCSDAASYMTGSSVLVDGGMVRAL